MAETYFALTNPGGGGVGSRIFDVGCNGEVLVRGLDIYKEAGGENWALEKRFRGLKPNAQASSFFNSFPPEAMPASMRSKLFLMRGFAPRSKATCKATKFKVRSNLKQLPLPFVGREWSAGRRTG
jgi:hypothetical protein